MLGCFVGCLVFFFCLPQPPICACVQKYPDERLPLWLACGKGGRRVDKERFSTRVGDTLPPLPATSSSFPSPRYLTLSSFSAPAPLLPLPACIWYPRQAGAAGGRTSPSSPLLLWEDHTLHVPRVPHTALEPGWGSGQSPTRLPNEGVLHCSSSPLIRLSFPAAIGEQWAALCRPRLLVPVLAAGAATGAKLQ